MYVSLSSFFSFFFFISNVCALYIYVVLDDAVKANVDNCICRNKKSKKWPRARWCGCDFLKFISLYFLSYISFGRYISLSHKIGFRLMVCLMFLFCYLSFCIFSWKKKLLLLAKGNVCSVEVLIDNWTEWNSGIYHLGWMVECVKQNRFWQLFEIMSEVRSMPLTDGCVRRWFILTLEIVCSQTRARTAYTQSYGHHTSTQIPIRDFGWSGLPLAPKSYE